MYRYPISNVECSGIKRGRQFMPSKDRDGFWFRHDKSPLPATQHAGETITGEALIDGMHPKPNTTIASPPDTFNKRAEKNYRFSNKFTAIDNRHFFCNDGTYLGNGQDTRYHGRRLAPLETRLHNATTYRLLEHHDRNWPGTSDRYNSVYKEQYNTVGCGDYALPSSGRYPKVYKEAQKGLRPPVSNILSSIFDFSSPRPRPRRSKMDQDMVSKYSESKLMKSILTRDHVAQTLQGSNTSDFNQERKESSSRTIDPLSTHDRQAAATKGDQKQLENMADKRKSELVATKVNPSADSTLSENVNSYHPSKNGTESMNMKTSTQTQQPLCVGDANDKLHQKVSEDSGSHSDKPAHVGNGPKSKIADRNALSDSFLPQIAGDKTLKAGNTMSVEKSTKRGLLKSVSENDCPPF